MPFISLPGVNSLHTREKFPKRNQWGRAKKIEGCIGIYCVKGG
jgi:hypothetical protein